MTLLSLANNNTISNTQIYNNWGGMYLQSSANNTFNNSQFYNNASY
ncbi:MAG: right-handed parallel beta-helix repeat-containing protein [bacterium]